MRLFKDAIKLFTLTEYGLSFSSAMAKLVFHAKPLGSSISVEVESGVRAPGVLDFTYLGCFK